MKSKLLLFCTVLVLGSFLRFWQLGNVPAGLNLDEVSQGYNAHSLLETGKDRYGKAFPILFKLFNTYQAPVYTYLTVIPVAIFDLSILSVKAVSAVSGVTVVIFTFLILNLVQSREKNNLSLIASLILAISPWAVFFSRVGTEASPSLALFMVGFFLCLKSVKKLKLFPLATLFLGFATHAYYSERIVSLLFLLGFVFIHREELTKNKKWLLLGLLVFALTQIPHLAILKSGAFSRRLEQVTYLDSVSFEKHGSSLKSVPFGRAIFVVREFAGQYLAYFSPRNLFFEPDDQPARSIPDLSVFYNWMIVPFLVGLSYIIKKRKDFFVRNLALLIFIAPIPAALSTDPFYSLRTQVLLWGLSIVVSIGVWGVLVKIRSKNLRILLFFSLLIFSLTVFYIHYFVLYRVERANTVGFSNIELINITEENSDKKYVVDFSRDIAVGLRFAFFRKYDPSRFQREIGNKFLQKYYTSIDHEQSYIIENVEVRPISWREDICKEQVLVGDPLAISEDQAKEHKLELEFELKDMEGRVSYRGYSTSPGEKCLTSKIRVY